MTDKTHTTYWDYIRIEDLLSLQSGLESDQGKLSNEEVLFITVHQVYELWFKLVLGELRACRNLFTKDPVAEQELSGAVRSMKRASTIFRQCASHFEVMETLTTREYLAFRDKLMPASGFQSAQMRQIEILFGLDEKERIPLGFEGSYMEVLKERDGSESAAARRVKAALRDVPNMKDAIEEWLFRTPIDGVPSDSPEAPARLEGFIERFLKATSKELDKTCAHAMATVMTNPEDAERLRARYAREKEAVREFLRPSEEEGGSRRARIRAAMLFIVTYRELPLLAWPRELLDALIELEQAFVVFRQRHARMVERVIGRRTGTGGSAGVDYLDSTALAYRVFRDLWAIRTIQLRREASPALVDSAFYGFKSAD